MLQFRDVRDIQYVATTGLTLVEVNLWASHRDCWQGGPVPYTDKSPYILIYFYL